MTEVAIAPVLHGLAVVIWIDVVLLTLSVSTMLAAIARHGWVLF